MVINDIIMKNRKETSYLKDEGNEFTGKCGARGFALKGYVLRGVGTTARNKQGRFCFKSLLYPMLTAWVTIIDTIQ